MKKSALRNSIVSSDNRHIFVDRVRSNAPSEASTVTGRGTISTDSTRATRGPQEQSDSRPAQQTGQKKSFID